MWPRGPPSGKSLGDRRLSICTADCRGIRVDIAGVGQPGIGGPCPQASAVPIAPFANVASGRDSRDRRKSEWTEGRVVWPRWQRPPNLVLTLAATSGKALASRRAHSGLALWKVAGSRHVHRGGRSLESSVVADVRPRRLRRDLVRCQANSAKGCDVWPRGRPATKPAASRPAH